jgi:hypothetical protein
VCVPRFLTTSNVLQKVKLRTNVSWITIVMVRTNVVLMAVHSSVARPEKCKKSLAFLDHLDHLDHQDYLVTTVPVVE